MVTLFLAICTNLAVLSFIDIRSFIVPPYLLLILAILCVFWNTHMDLPLATILIQATGMMLLAIALRYGVYFFTKKIGCGWGDVWLFFLCGLVLPLDMWATFFLITGGSGILFGYMWKRIKGQNRFPFVPCISLGLATALWLQLPIAK